MLVLGVSSLRAADSKIDEAAVRAAIASEHAKYTDDAIFWCGAFKRPFVRPEKGEEFPGHEISKRSNEKNTTDTSVITQKRP